MLRLREEKGVGGLENKGNSDEYLEEKTLVGNIEERRQGLRTSRVDTRLRTPVPRRRSEGGWERKQLRIEKQLR